jgi:hypothetical protein
MQVKLDSGVGLNLAPQGPFGWRLSRRTNNNDNQFHNLSRIQPNMRHTQVIICSFRGSEAEYVLGSARIFGTTPPHTRMRSYVIVGNECNFYML